jgi:alkyl sulfatase BDS1-like metallo-beta-lactamase superfamily hydrolase
LASHAVFADPDNGDAKVVLAEVLETLGYGSECATWRNCFLNGAHELRHGIKPTSVAAATGMAPAMTTTQLFDSIAVRIDGPKAGDTTLSINWDITDTGEHYRMELSNGAVVHVPTRAAVASTAVASTAVATDLTVTLTRPQLLALLFTGSHDGVTFTGDPATLPKLLALTDNPDPSFPVVTP